jgi:chromosome partitioning protein
MHIWTVANQKGGVGKTTTTVAIADYLASQGYRTLMLDLDPQGSLTTYFQQDPDKMIGTAYDIFDQQTRVQALDTGFENLRLIGSSIGLAKLEKSTETVKGKGLVVKSFLRSLASEYDYVVIDTPPGLGKLMVNALVACEQLIIPAQTDFLTLKALERMVKVLKMLASSRVDLNYKILPTMFDKRTNASKRTLMSLKNLYGGKVSPIVVPTDTKLRDASRMGVPPSFLFPRCQGVQAYQRFVQFLLEAEAIDSPVKRVVDEERATSASLE